MDIFLITETDRINVKCVGGLSDTDYKRFKDAERVISSFEYFVANLNIVFDNLDELTKQVQIEIIKLSEKSELEELTIDSKTNLNRRLMNYLVSWRFCVDQNTKKVKEKFGENSEVYATTQSLTKHLFDTSFAYRFTYNLRNYISHATLPINSFKFQSDSNTTKAEVLISSKLLMDGSSKWSAKVKRELMTMDSIEIISISREAYFRLAELQISTTKLLLPEVIVAGMNMVQIFGDKLLGPGRLVVGDVLRDGDSIKKISYEDVPIERLKKLKLL